MNGSLRVTIEYYKFNEVLTAVIPALADMESTLKK
jgi:hypothetical protein